MAEKNENLAAQVQIVRETVETVLPRFGRRNEYSLYKLRGQMSTDPRKVGPLVSQATLSMKCGESCRELQPLIQGAGFDAELYRSGDHPAFDHLHLSVPTPAGEVVVDPTIGQFLIGHNHVYVGTRADLGKMIRQVPVGPYMFDARFNTMSPDAVFRLIWGSYGIPDISYHRSHTSLSIYPHHEPPLTSSLDVIGPSFLVERKKLLRRIVNLSESQKVNKIFRKE